MSIKVPASGAPSLHTHDVDLRVLLSTTSSSRTAEIIFFNIQSASKAGGSFHILRISTVGLSTESPYSQLTCY